MGHIGGSILEWGTGQRERGSRGGPLSMQGVLTWVSGWMESGAWGGVHISVTVEAFLAYSTW